MNRIICSLMAASVLLSMPAIASDSTVIKTKKAVRWSIAAGYTYNTVYGSMVDRTNMFADNVKMEKKGGYSVQLNLEAPFSEYVFLQTGLGIIKKQVNPMVNSGSVYEDELRTTYLCLPLLLGVRTQSNGQVVNFAFTAGPIANFRLADNSKSGPDRVGFKTSFINAGICGGAAILFKVQPAMELMLQYRYMHDLTDSYVERLYWTSDEPNKKFVYKYKTSLFSLGIQWSPR